MINLKEEKAIRLVFIVSIILKGLHSLMEIIGGLIFFFVSTNTIRFLVNLLTFQEVFEDPHDIVANYLLRFAHSLTIGEKSFIALYLLAHGVVKLIVVVALLKNKLWAYPAALVVFGAFIAYQVYRFTHTYSIDLILLSIFDLFVMWLIWHEYQLAKRHQLVKVEGI